MWGKNKNSSRTLQQKFPEQYIIMWLEANSENHIYDHQKYYIDKLIGILIQQEDFLKSMFTESLIENLWILETHYDNTNPTFIKLIQTYQKFAIKKLQEEDPEYNIRKLQSISGDTFSNYIENLIFAEFLSQLFGIGESNNLIINNSVYSLYVVSMGEDQRKWVDLVVKNQAGEYIGIDITKQKIGKESWTSTIQNHPYKSKIIFNYNFFQKIFNSFFKNYMQYLFENKQKPEILNNEYIDIKKSLSFYIQLNGENKNPTNYKKNSQENIYKSKSKIFLIFRNIY